MRTLCGEVPAPAMRVCLALHLDAQRLATNDGERHQVVNVVEACLDLQHPALVISNSCSAVDVMSASRFTSRAQLHGPRPWRPQTPVLQEQVALERTGISHSGSSSAVRWM